MRAESLALIATGDAHEIANAIVLLLTNFPDLKVAVTADSEKLTNGHVAATRPTGAMQPSPEPDVTVYPDRFRKNGSKRWLVAKATKGRWMTVDQIVAETGLTAKQVRGAMEYGKPPYQFESQPTKSANGNRAKKYRLVET